jgi:adenosylcobinamide-phosphate synthase
LLPVFFLNNILLAVGASFLDRFMGDPESWPHVVKVFGRLIKAFDKLLNRGSKVRRLISGALFALGLTASVYFVSFYALLTLKDMLPAWAYWSVLLFLANQCVSYKDLKKEAMKIYDSLQEKDLEKARHQVKRIVGRDTEELEPEAVVAATVESVAESTPDGILMPLFFLCVGGLPAALAAKAVNTMDSMIGHRDEDYEYFGKVAARLDDLLGFLPSRVSFLLFAVAAGFTRDNAGGGLRLALSQGHTHASVNAGYSEASMAGSLGIRLGGRVSYEGEVCERPIFDGGENPLEESCILKALRLSALSQWLFLLFLLTGVLWWMA